MPVPFILGGLALTLGGWGLKKGIDAKEKMEKAKAIGEEINTIVEISNKAMNLCKDEAKTSLEELGKEKIIILSSSMKKFVDVYKNLKNVNYRELGIDELENFKPHSESFQELNIASVGACDIAINGIGAIGSGALLSAGAYGAVMYGGFAAASTGTMIGTLSGAAATNATLAWLGGGSLAAGGFGMAGGMAVLGGIVAGPALLLGGFMLDSKAEDALYDALSKKDEALKFQKQVNEACVSLKAISNRADQIKNLLARLDILFKDQVNKMSTVVDLLGVDYSKYSLKAKNVVCISAMLAQIIKIVVDTTLLNKEGQLTSNSDLVIKCFGQVKGAEDTIKLQTSIKDYSKLSGDNRLTAQRTALKKLPSEDVRRIENYIRDGHWIACKAYIDARESAGYDVANVKRMYIMKCR